MSFSEKTRLVLDANGIANFVKEDIGPTPGVEILTSYTYTGFQVYRKRYTGTTFPSSPTILESPNPGTYVNVRAFNFDGDTEIAQASSGSNQFLFRADTAFVLDSLSGSYLSRDYDITVDYHKSTAPTTDEMKILSSDSNGIMSFVHEELAPTTEQLAPRLFNGLPVFYKHYTGTVSGLTEPLENPAPGDMIDVKVTFDESRTHLHNTTSTTQKYRVTDFSSTGFELNGMNGIFASCTYRTTYEYIQAVALTGEADELIADSNGVANKTREDIGSTTAVLTGRTHNGKDVYTKRYTGTTGASATFVIESPTPGVIVSVRAFNTAGRSKAVAEPAAGIFLRESAGDLVFAGLAGGMLTRPFNLTIEFTLP